MLRIHFTGADLARTRVAEEPDPLWETVLSLQMLRARYGAGIFDGWRRRTRRALSDSGQVPLLRRALFPVTPDAAYFPDFLTPPEGLTGLTAGLEAVRATPPRRLKGELRRIGGRPSGWLKRLAEADREAVAELCAGLGAYHRSAVAPYWDRMAEAARVDAFRRRRGRGVGAVLDGFSPKMRWRDPVLEVAYPVHKDLHLDGRGLVLVPSCFCWHNPVALADPALPPTLVYPLRPTRTLLDLHPATAAPAGALARLIGATRARVLALASSATTTTELARSLDISPATASQHAAVLRDSGLVTSHRAGNTVIHTITPLGDRLLGR